MATVEDVKKLSTLARIKVEEGELEKFTKEFDAILAYVGQLESLKIPEGIDRKKPALYNVMRKDGEPHETRKYTEKLAEQFPAREGDALVVKQVITHE